MTGASHGGRPRAGASRRRSSETGYNPVVTSDGVRWRDYEFAAELTADEWRPQRRPPVIPPDAFQILLREGAAPGVRPVPRAHPGSGEAGGEDWFDGLERPPRLDQSRPYGVPGGLAWPDPQLQRDLCQALPEGARFPDPRGTWIRLINGEGPGEDPFRATNALDCALAVVSTWHGEPTVAAPRRPEYDRLGRPSLGGETGGAARAERWLGHRFEYAGQGRRAYATVAQRLAAGGHGAAAVLITRWPSGGDHAWNAVNTAGEVVWIDAQRGHTSVDPPPGPVSEVFCVALDRGGRPV
ncbi:hypothetical protein Sme01_39700 [Sphaerisporangium melleum]|uniref:Tox-PL domain-containing protein n=1 Tax=Sphaerisporangium melleum TaxID=321316 RepID=A0A917VIF9_9ACTN|nr:toxin glutamine deamidase domain-containing protein [Sphaerisporangium melleum]GGK86310.1 hypothetical protein GCM10007964_31120 [Sphaerisporangium melleum]GII71494.1 hypothetical protein Sme01_39700 [Sphaerisporangium melleum]